MQRISIGFSRHCCALGGLALAALLCTTIPSYAGQQLDGFNPYSAVDPFDPSETVTHSLKDDIRLRLRLPAPDLPLSVVKAKQPAPKPKKLTARPEPAFETASTPGIFSKSIGSVMSIFDWSEDNTEVAAKASTPDHSNEPIRINVHVGIKKPQQQAPAKMTDDQVSTLQTPWGRNQERVRRLFTFGEIKNHE